MTTETVGGTKVLYSLKVQGIRIQYFLADLIVYLVTSILIALFKFSNDFSDINFQAYVVTILVLGIIYLGLLYLSGNYEPNAVMEFNSALYLRAIIYTAALFFVSSFYIRTISYSRVYFTTLFIITLLVSIIIHLALNKFHKRIYNGELNYPMVAVGFEKSEQGSLEKAAKLLGLNIVAELNSQSIIAQYEKVQKKLIDAKNKETVDDLGILLYEEGNGEYQELISFCEEHYIPLYILPSATRMLSVPLQAVNHKGLIIFGPKDLLVDGVSKRLKRTVDVILAVLGLLLSSWLMLLIWVIVKVSSRGPGLYTHERLGLDGKVIKIYKFRTMANESDKMLEDLLKDENIRKRYFTEYKIEDDPRVTKVGRYLRKLSLDELPQFWNIFRGDISFVGPRPIIPPEIARYGSNGKLILRVKPGLTGLWQVSGRNDVSYEERIKLDLYYIHNWSLGMDFKIILQTIPSVMLQRGAS